jgi:hypothetical protein
MPPMPNAAPTEPPGKQLRIAARGRTDPQDGSPDAILGLVVDEIRKQQREWQGALGQLRGMLDTVDHTLASAAETQEAEVGRLIQALADRNEAAAQQIRAEAESQIARLQADIQRHETDIRSAREALQSATAQVEAERGGRRQAEEDRDKARRAHQVLASATEAQVKSLRDERDALSAEVSDLTRQIESVRAERTKLANALAAIREAVSVAPATETAASAGREIADSRAQHLAAQASTAATPNEPSAVDAVAITPIDPELADHVKRLLEQAKDMYLSDIKSGTSPVEVVDRLTAILRYSHDLVMQRSADNPAAGADAFNEEVNRLLDAEAATDFGRHLSIAAFAARNNEAAAD